jgi:hypothetical protein
MDRLSGMIIVTQDPGHAYGSITDTMKVLKIGKREKRKHLNTLEKCNIYKMSKNSLHINDTCNYVHNPIFEALRELNTNSVT